MNIRRRLPGARLAVIFLLLVSVRAGADESADDGVYGDPLPRNWPAPVYPAEALQAGVGGRVTVEFVVDAQGRVIDPVIRENGTQPGDPRLEAAVLAAVRQWTFDAALDDGKPVARALVVPVTFYPKGSGGLPAVALPPVPELAPTKPAQIVYQPDPVYPDELLIRKLPGSAEFEFEVSVQGRADKIRVNSASGAAFVVAGRETLRRWKFKPGHQGPLPVVTRQAAPMEFSVEGDQTKPEDVMLANGLAEVAATPDETAPAPIALYPPVYPFARLAAGEKGEAEVEFVVGEDGLTKSEKVTMASAPEFGASLMAAVALWRFSPATLNGEKILMALRVHQWYTVPEQGPEARVVAALRTGIGQATGLDRKLQPIWRIAPRYPDTLLAEKKAGEAVIEFIIDREGRVRLPRVVSATAEAFGWAAATALSQWVFDPPTRNGEAVDVRVSIPISFAAPAN